MTTITQLIDAARSGFIAEFSPNLEPFGLALSDGQWRELQRSRLAHSRVTKENLTGGEVLKYAGLVILVFRSNAMDPNSFRGGAVGPMVTDERMARELLSLGWAGPA